MNVVSASAIVRGMAIPGMPPSVLVIAQPILLGEAIVD
jgi:hypothetical protein